MDESDAAALTSDSVLQNGNSGDFTKGGEEGVKVGVGEGEVDVGDVDGGLRGSQAAGAAGIIVVFGGV